MFFRRGVADDDPWLTAKLWIFGIGALLALVGMLFENDWLIGGAAVVLLAGVLLRFVSRRTDGADEAEAGQEKSAAPE